MRFLGSITNRIFLASALLGILSIGAAVYFVSAQLSSQTEADLQSDLNGAASLGSYSPSMELDGAGVA